MLPSIYWSNRLQMYLWIPVYVCLTVVPSLSRSALSPTCPRDLEAHVHSCFTDYSLNSQSLQSSPLKLCCGVDVETLRIFCHSYTKALRCLQSLKTRCPASQHHVIDKMLTNADGESKAGLMELCQDDYVIESYAMYQECFERVGHQSENCLTSYLKDSPNIQFLSKVNTKQKDTFCRNMRHAVGCVRRNVELACGVEAGGLAVLLVRPMVRDSSQCDYSTLDHDKMGSQSRNKERPAYISDESKIDRDGKSGNSDSKKSNNNRRRHNDKNSNSERFSNRGTNSDSHSGKNPGGGSSSIRLTGFHCNRILLTCVFVLFTTVLRMFLTRSQCC